MGRQAKTLALSKSGTLIGLYRVKGRRWRCRCSECGKFPVVEEIALKKGSACCACQGGETMQRNSSWRTELRKELYSRWNILKRRCYDEKYSSFHLYGGRGIKMDPVWRDSFKAFAEWMKSKGCCIGCTPRIPGGLPMSEHKIQRKNENGDYTPENCFLASKYKLSKKIK